MFENNHFIGLPDDNTEITYSDLKTDAEGKHYITLYFETPNGDLGFKSMDVDYPEGVVHHVVGYSKEEVQNLYQYYKQLGKTAFKFAKREQEDGCFSTVKPL